MVQYTKTERVCCPAQKLLEGEVQSVTSDSLIVMKLCDRWDARRLSTLHSYEIVNTGKCDWKTEQPVVKPKCILITAVNWV